MKIIGKLAILAAAGAATVVAIRRYDLLNKGAGLVEQGVEKAAEGAEWLTAKAVEVTDELLTKYDNFVNEATSDQAKEDDDVVVDERADATAGYRRDLGGEAPTYGDVR